MARADGEITNLAFKMQLLPHTALIYALFCGRNRRSILARRLICSTDNSAA